MALGVALGAFGAHGLKTRVEEPLLAVWETGVRYHLIHGVALVALGILSRASPDRAMPFGISGCFGVGILLFSGSLYVMTLTGMRWLGAITPLGGVAFIAGWVWLAVASLQTR